MLGGVPAGGLGASGPRVPVRARRPAANSCKRRLQPPDPIDPKLPNRNFFDLYVSSCTLSMILEEKGGVLFDFRNYRHLKWGFHTNLNSLIFRASLLTRVSPLSLARRGTLPGSAPPIDVGLYATA